MMKKCLGIKIKMGKLLKRYKVDYVFYEVIVKRNGVVIDDVLTTPNNLAKVRADLKIRNYGDFEIITKKLVETCELRG